MALPFPVRFAIVNAGAELVGLGGVGALSAWAALSIGPDASAFAPVVVALGALEGVVVGAAQARLVREKVPSLRTRAWVGATIVGAVLAWALGMLPSMLLGGGGAGTPAPALAPAVELLLAAGLGAVAGPILGGAQALVLRRHARRAGAWVLANALAWAAGMPIVFAAMGAMPAVGPDAAWVAAVTVALLATGFVVGAIEGLFLDRVIVPRPTR